MSIRINYPGYLVRIINIENKHGRIIDNIGLQMNAILPSITVCWTDELRERDTCSLQLTFGTACLLGTIN